jgi:tRNA uridine 5-carbamoylmethylation protein Kti12
MTKVINLFAGPGAGKSTTAAGLFFHLKSQNIKCELVTEYAKDMTYEKRHNILTDQLYILAKQNRRLSRLVGTVDYIITDSPLIIGLAYVPDNYFPSFSNLVSEIFNSYDNCNYFIKRNKPYQKYGRNQTEEEAKEKDIFIRNLLMSEALPFKEILGTKEILEDLGL